MKISKKVLVKQRIFNNTHRAETTILQKPQKSWNREHTIEYNVCTSVEKQKNGIALV